MSEIKYQNRLKNKLVGLQQYRFNFYNTSNFWQL